MPGVAGGAGLTYLLHLQQQGQPYLSKKRSIGSLRLSCRLWNGGLDSLDLGRAETRGGSLVLRSAEARANRAL